jgi:hypothetical protein
LAEEDGTMGQEAEHRDEVNTEPLGDSLSRLVTELGRAAREGWGTTVRLVVLLLVVSGGFALLLVVSR